MLQILIWGLVGWWLFVGGRISRDTEMIGRYQFPEDGNRYHFWVGIIAGIFWPILEPFTWIKPRSRGGE